MGILHSFHHTRMETLTLPVLPSQKAKNYLPRLADALGQMKLAKDAITEEFEHARVLAIATGEQEFSGTQWKATIMEVESKRIDSEKLDKFLAKHDKSIDDFKIPSTSSRLLLKAIA